MIPMVQYSFFRVKMSMTSLLTSGKRVIEYVALMSPVEYFPRIFKPLMCCLPESDQ